MEIELIDKRIELSALVGAYSTAMFTCRKLYPEMPIIARNVYHPDPLFLKALIDQLGKCRITIVDNPESLAEELFSSEVTPKHRSKKYEDKTHRVNHCARWLQRLPRKNILPVNGTPLIGWTIKAAIDCPYIDRVFVSTDDDEIAEVSRQFGAEIIARPDEARV
ncbi:hypothetical protein P4S64_23145 [Vibrio sp. M60_M31a]